VDRVHSSSLTHCLPCDTANNMHPIPDTAHNNHTAWSTEIYCVNFYHTLAAYYNPDMLRFFFIKNAVLHNVVPFQGHENKTKNSVALFSEKKVSTAHTTMGISNCVQQSTGLEICWTFNSWRKFPEIFRKTRDYLEKWQFWDTPHFQSLVYNGKLDMPWLTSHST